MFALVSIVLQLLSTVIMVTGDCTIAEFACNTSLADRQCIPLDRYCNGFADCLDGSDEPRFCTICNRTYYGEVGRTYALEIQRPNPNDITLPFVCHLTFNANGSQFGDIIQVNFESFSLGQLNRKCSDGHLKIDEHDRPHLGGLWCGRTWHTPVTYFSETKTIRLSIIVSFGNGAHTRTGTGTVFDLERFRNTFFDNFDFRIEYKMLNERNATVRYGSSENKQYLGELMTGTYCSRIFKECDRHRCRIQSPNYPGIYPRNVTCYYAVRQNRIPVGQRALIRLWQRPGQSIRLETTASNSGDDGNNNHHDDFDGGGANYNNVIDGTSFNTANSRLKMWRECANNGDHVTVYDGYTTRDPIILRFCGSSATTTGIDFPETISSGHEMLIEFQSGPYASLAAAVPDAAAAAAAAAIGTGSLTGTGDGGSADSHRDDSGDRTRILHGFQLDIQVQFVRQQTSIYTPNKHICEFWIRGTDRGQIENPKHSLVPNTTCLYHLQGIDFGPVSLKQQQQQTPLQPQFLKTNRFPPQRFRVWISIVKFHEANQQQQQQPQLYYGGGSGSYGGDNENYQQCSGSYLNIWDGYLSSTDHCHGFVCASENKGRASGSKNVTLLARYCKENLAKSCDHFARVTDRRQAQNRKPRPCSPTESYVSSGDSLTLEFKTSESMFLRPASFRAFYEFVDYHLDGEPLQTTASNQLCSRKFTKSFAALSGWKFQSPKNVFLFGRGGSKNLRCTYRFEAEPHETIELTLTQLRIALNRRQSRCTTQHQPDIGRYQCAGGNNSIVPTIEIIEEFPLSSPQTSIRLTRDCFCNVTTPWTAIPYTFRSQSNIIEIRLVAANMSTVDDFESLAFEGAWQTQMRKNCLTTTAALLPVLESTSGQLQIAPATASECLPRPQLWLIRPQPNRYLYAKLNGFVMHANDRNDSQLGQRCLTSNRIVLATIADQRLQQSPYRLTVCPEISPIDQHRQVEFYSNGWFMDAVSPSSTTSRTINRNDFIFGSQLTRALIVEFIANDKQHRSYSLTWLQLAKRNTMVPFAQHLTGNGTRTNQIPEVAAAGAAASSNNHPYYQTNIMIVDNDASDIGGHRQHIYSIPRQQHHHGQFACYQCPELPDACLNATIFCDGIEHCPSGYDESLAHCSLLFQLPISYLTGGLVLMFLFLLITFTLTISCKVFCDEPRMADDGDDDGGGGNVYGKSTDELMVTSSMPVNGGILAGTKTKDIVC